MLLTELQQEFLVGFLEGSLNELLEEPLKELLEEPLKEPPDSNFERISDEILGGILIRSSRSNP